MDNMVSEILFPSKLFDLPERKLPTFKLSILIKALGLVTDY